MDKSGEEILLPKSLHYSIPALLWIGYLCETKKTTFDLARLSFAVYHAGFVKPSSAYSHNVVMPLQNISVNRNRGWSLDTASSVEDYVMFSGSARHVVEPQRQPVNAPGSPGGHVQADEGFLRFLKTHSSPTHQRVTAGGRIVPMEPSAAPPQFKLLAGNSSRSSVVLNNSIHKGIIGQEQDFDCSSKGTSNEPKLGIPTSFNSKANSQISNGERLLRTPFPKFYDGQTGQQDIKKAATESKQISLRGATSVEHKGDQLRSHVLDNGQPKEQARVRPLEAPILKTATSQSAATIPPQTCIPVSGPNSTGQVYGNPYHPQRMPGSQKPAPTTSQYISNTVPLALEETSHAMPPYFGGGSQGTDFNAYPGVNIGPNPLALRPSPFPALPPSVQIPPLTSLRMCNGQLGPGPQGYYVPDHRNQPASLPPALVYHPFAEAPVPPVGPFAPNSDFSMPQTHLILQDELAMAESEFEKLTERERLLDQYLAMHMDKMDLQTRRACSEKRMEIVEQRAAAKDRMNRFQQALNTDIVRRTTMEVDSQSHYSHLSTTTSRSVNRLNVQAPSWVPKATVDGSKAVRIQNPNLSATAASVTAPDRTLTSQENVNRTNVTPPTPLTPLTPLTPQKFTAAESEDPFTTQQAAVVFSPEKSPVDEWGARLGAAPPELERQQSAQSEFLERMASEASRASSSSQYPVANIPGFEGSCDAQNELVPPPIEADHEQYLDAIRKDHGSVSTITLCNGQVVQVKGQSYKQPKLSYMSSAFEKYYWLRKPDLDEHVTTSHSRPIGRSFENLMRAPLPQKSKHTQEWVDDIADNPKHVSSGRAPWETEKINLLSTKCEPSISLQDAFAMSKTRGTNGAAGHLRGRC